MVSETQIYIADGPVFAIGAIRSLMLLARVLASCQCHSAYAQQGRGMLLMAGNVAARGLAY